MSLNNNRSKLFLSKKEHTLEEIHNVITIISLLCTVVSIVSGSLAPMIFLLISLYYKVDKKTLIENGWVIKGERDEQ